MTVASSRWRRAGSIVRAARSRSKGTRSRRRAAARSWRDWRASEVIDAERCGRPPGYVDAHLHANAQTCRGFFRGDASKGSKVGPSYADWKATLTPTTRTRGGARAVEMLRHGITTFVEPGSAFEPDAVAAATQQVGHPLHARRTVSVGHDRGDGRDSGLASKALFARVPPERDRCLKLLGSQLFRNKDSDGITHGHVALYGEGTASDELYVAAKAIADRERT
jgi:hypothetical protein